MIVNKVPKDFLGKVFWIQNQIQFNHWIESNSGWQHEVLGDYYKEISANLDTLVESIAGTFGRQSLMINDEMYRIIDDMDNLSLANEINSIILSFRKSFESENGIINVIDEMLELNNSTIYKLGLR